jgi:hypothetical protein
LDVLPVARSAKATLFGTWVHMKIISHEESRQILRNLYKKEAMEKYSEELRGANPGKRKIIMTKIDMEVEDRVRQQIVTGH